jgi:exopolyphosphatase/guanosine-5'-triphosphate,3'-diphosphate pyrophosphatase
MCLRLAIIACHARAPVDADALALRRTGATAMLAVPAQWAETHPRTVHLLNEEVQAWERGGPLQLALRA